MVKTAGGRTTTKAGQGQTSSALSVKDKIKAAKLATRTVDICLHTELQDEFERLDQQLQETVAREALDKRLNSGGESRRLAEQIEALRERMAEHVITFTLRSLGNRGWSDLVDAHPPRDGNKFDVAAGHNTDTFFDAAIRASVTAPDLDDEDWRTLLGDNEEVRARLEAEGKADQIEDGKLTAAQYRDLQNAALALNIRPVSVPNSFAASRILRASETE